MKLSKAMFFLIVCACFVMPVVSAQAADNDTREAALQRLQSSAGGMLVVSKHKATGAARFIRLRPEANTSLGITKAATKEEKREQSLLFFRNFGDALGISDAGSLRLQSEVTDQLGETHLTWKQFYKDVPVFAGTIKTHFDALNQLKAVAGTAVPDIAVNTTPTWKSESAAEAARNFVIADRGKSDQLRIGKKTLYIFREGLVKGVPGNNHLAWEIEVTDGAGIRDFVYVSAHTGKVIDRITGVHDDLFRRAYNGRNLPNVPRNYPNGPYWVEGDKFPTKNQEANNMIIASEETYRMFENAFGYLSFDGNDAVMDAIFNRGYGCPNASWNGTFISFCPGYTTDDVTAHEWGHAYTQYANNLIYQWQSGALNESYSDIWGELIDLINNRGVDAPGGPRSAGACSSFSPPVGKVTVNSPAGIAGDKFAQSASFGPSLTETGITNDVVAALDPADAAGPSTLDGCSALTNAGAVSGKIAIINRGTCTFVQKVLNAQAAGAVGVIIANNAANGLPPMGFAAGGENVTIPSLGIQQGDGNAIRTALQTDVVNATLLAEVGEDQSYRWLMGEEITVGGALRDMWNPTCYSNPGKVTDTAYYICNATDNGGVHINSGIPNHAFALLIDGGTFNGETVTPIGPTKAAHIYFRAATVYHVDDSDFVDHADALEQSCEDLTGAPLNALTGGPSGEVISAADCAEVTNAIEAVELRTLPAFCNFGTLLNPALPALCGATTTSGVVEDIQLFDFESDPGSSWTIDHFAASPSFTPRDWTWVSTLPDGRAGSGFFAPDPNSGNCVPTDDETGLLNLTSPSITLPPTTDFARATFEHWVATEPAVDGGILLISVNGGPFQFVPPSEFTFNNYIVFLLGSTNPLAGLPAWSGTDPGFSSEGSWGRTHVNLGNFAGPGDSIRLRWVFGSDCGTGATGWYLDNVNIFSCDPNDPEISIEDLEIEEGNAGVSDAHFVVTLSTPTIANVAVNFQIVNGTAKAGQDFKKNSGGTLVIPAGATEGEIIVSVKGDTKVEGSETFSVVLSGPVNGTILDGEAQGTITEDD
jgi:Zn-dependent metalloprotease